MNIVVSVNQLRQIHQHIVRQCFAGVGTMGHKELRAGRGLSADVVYRKQTEVIRLLSHVRLMFVVGDAALYQMG